MEIKNTYMQALLAEAAYSDFEAAKKDDGSFDQGRIAAVLVAEGFSPTQADDFLVRWEVVDHHPEDSSGFSATLFRDRAIAHHHVLAIRGTQDFADLAEDYNGITRLGYARDQIYSLYNYFTRLITPKTEAVWQWQVAGSRTLPGGVMANRVEPQALYLQGEAPEAVASGPRSDHIYGGAGDDALAGGAGGKWPAGGRI